MHEDLFAGLTDTAHDRNQRKNLVRQKWIAFWSALGAIVLMAAAAGIGGAVGASLFEHRPGVLLDHVLGGLVGGFSGGLICFLWMLYRLVRRSVLDEVFDGKEEVNVGASLFWTTVAGTGLFGCAGASGGLIGGGAFGWEVQACASVAVLLALIPAWYLRGFARRRSRTGSGFVGYKEN